MSSPKSYQFPVDLTQALVSYLATKPWNEVNGLIAGMSQHIQAQEQEAKDAPPTSLPTLDSQSATVQ